MPGPVVCFSYLAAAELWQVGRFPSANDGAEVQGIEHSIAADGPMVAAVLAALDTPTSLLTNGLGADANGSRVRARLADYGVPFSASMTPHAATPQIVVVADDQQTRTWFPYLPGVADALAGLDLTPLKRAGYAYIDCYRLIEIPAIRAISAARAAGVPLLLNLGGSPLGPAVVAAVRDYRDLVVQTNVADTDHASAAQVAAAILAATGAAWAIVTSGANGVVALGRLEQLSLSAFRATVRHTHCAGAAFSGGLLYGLLHAWPMRDSLELACASGALRCERAGHEPMPTVAELSAFIDSRERLISSEAPVPYRIPGVLHVFIGWNKRAEADRHTP